MKTRYEKWLGLLFFVGTLVSWLPTPSTAQDDASGSATELYRKMYEGGLITQTEYERALANSDQPSDASSSAVVDTAAPSAAKPKREFRK